MTDFFSTRMGQRFYEDTAPRIAKALERVADALEKPPLRVAAEPELAASQQVQVQIADARALDRLAQLVDAKVLTSSAIEEIREILRGTGRRAREP